MAGAVWTTRDAESVDVMKRLASGLTWWHMLPHKNLRGQPRSRGEASHGPSWHRRAQDGKSDLLLRPDGARGRPGLRISNTYVDLEPVVRVAGALDKCAYELEEGRGDSRWNL